MSELKLVAKLALPLIISFLAQRGIQLVDTYMLGWLGVSALAAGALATTSFMLIVVFCMGTMSAIGIFISHARGANQTHKISAIIQNSFYIAVFLSIPCGIVIWTIPYLLARVGENPLVVQNTTEFLHALLWGIPGVLVFCMLREVLSAFGRLQFIIIVCFCAIPLTFLTNYCLMYGKFGLPALGIAGIGYASSLVEWLMAASLYLYMLAHPQLKTYLIPFQFRQISFKTIWEIMRIGIPSGIIFLFDNGMIWIAALMIGSISVEALAAHQIALQYVSVSYTIPLALSIAVGLRIGYEMGAKNLLKAKRLAYLGLMIALVISIIIALIFWLCPITLIKIFVSSKESYGLPTERLAVILLGIAALFQCFDAIQATLNGILRGFKDTFFPMIATCVCFWLVGLSFSYYWGIKLNFGAAGVWYGLTVGIVMASVILLLRFLYKVKCEEKLLAQIILPPQPHP